MHKPLTVLAFALATLAPVVAAAPDAPKLVLIHTESRIDIDADGNVTAIRTTPELPPEVQAVVEGNLRKLRYAAPVKDGRAVSGVTYALQDACAVPVDGSFRFAVKYRGNGPSMARREHPPIYPLGPMRQGIGAKWSVEYIVGADGKGSVASLKLLDGGGGRSDGEFRKTLHDWISAMPFQPEQVDGQPVATRMRTEVSFMVDAKHSDLQKANEERNLACKVALDASGKEAERTVALDSPFKLIVAAN